MADQTKSQAEGSALCPTCGTRVTAGAKTCPVCGASLQAGSRKATRSTRGQVVLSLPAALGILGFFTVLAVGLTYLATRTLGPDAVAEAVVTATLTPTETLTPQPTPTDTPIPTPTPLPTLEYIVDVNDTLGAIAVRYDVSIQSILQLNPGLNSESILTVGQRLYLPQPTPTPSPEPTSTLPPEEATRAACETLPYTVAANDTLGFIAANYNVNPRAIMDFNGLTSETVFVGQVLIIPLCERNPTPGPSPTPTLRESEYYRVTVEDITEGSGTRRILGYVKDTKYIVPVDFRPAEAIPHVMRWWVQVVRQIGVNAESEPIYVNGGAQSIKRDFTWSGAVPGATATPQ